MSERDAKVRLELAAGGFLTMLREIQKQAEQLGNEVEGIGESGEKAEKKLHPALASMKKGFGAAKSALSEFGSSIKSAIGDLTTLGGALTLGAGARAAIETVDAYKDIAFAVQTSTGKAQQWQTVQGDIEGTARKWKIANGEVAASYLELFKTTEDLDFTRAAMESIGQAHRATGASVATLTALANELNEKFGVTPDKIDSAMATLIGAVPGGKAGLEELGDKLGLLGASARAVGYEGEAGLKKALGMLNLAGAGGGSFKKELMSVIQLFETLGDSDQVKRIEKTLGHGTKLRDKAGKTKADALEIIMRETGGKHEELSKIFSGPLLRFSSELGKTYATTFAGTAGDAKTKTKAATEALSRAMETAGKSSLTSADLQRQATERLKDPKAQLQDAMNKFQQALTKPEMMASMEKLAQLLPKLTSGMTSLLEMAVDHPILAAGAFLGKKGGGAMLGSVAGDAAGWTAGKAAGLGKSIGSNLAAEAAKNGAWATAGSQLAKVAGIAIAAAVAYELGKQAIDEVFATTAQDEGDLAALGAGAAAVAASGDKKAMAAHAETLRSRIKQAQENEDSVGGFVKNTFGGVAEIVSGGDVKQDIQKDNIARAEAELRNLESAMAKGAKGGDKVATAHERAAAAAERLAKAMDKVKPGGAGGGNNGLPPAPGNQSGSAPR